MVGSVNMQFLVVVSINLFVSSIALGYPHNQNDKPVVQDQEAEEDADSDMYMEAANEESKAQSQTFIPSFAPFHNPPLGHSRPYYYQPEAAYSHRPNAYQQQVTGYDSASRFSGYKGNVFNAHSSGSEGILGSGNFGVLKGGTFYNDNDGAASSYAEFDPFYQNGHGRQHYYFGGNPPPRQHEQFANFRDFADINTPSSPAYSHFVVVYANKNGTTERSAQKPKILRPKNIIEHLAMLDLETSTATSTEAEAVPTKKLSKSKRKLAKLLPEKKQRTKGTISNKKLELLDAYEPLLALS